MNSSPLRLLLLATSGMGAGLACNSSTSGPTYNPSANDTNESNWESGDTQNDVDESENETPNDDGDDSETDASTNDEQTGAYTGDLEIILYTQFGEDTCSGSMDLDIDDAMGLNGSGRCSFSILGSQVPLFEGELSTSGSTTGTVDLEAFGTDFQLEWTGNWSETEISCDYSGSSSLDSIGDIDYEIRFELQADIENDTDVPGGSDYVDFAVNGTQTASIDQGTFTSSDGCEMDYEMYTPNGASSDTLVVIQHGFARSKDQFSEWSSHLASWGIPSLLMNLCHSSAWDVNLDQNGEDVVELVESLHDGPAIYMGHSNGAISSLVSAALDDQAVAVLGLDAVERLVATTPMMRPASIFPCTESLEKVVPVIPGTAVHPPSKPAPTEN